MAERELSSRIIHKHDSAENWAKATNFIPKQGELIVYDRDSNYSYERFKIGDGITGVNTLPFSSVPENVITQEVLEQQLEDADFATNTDLSELETKVDAVPRIHIGPTEPTDPDIKIWINTSEDGTGVIPLLPRIATVTLASNAWTGSASPYSQVVAVNSVTVSSKIDLQPTAQQIVSLQNDDIALMAENNAGTVTFYALGGKPAVDYTMQVLLTEVAYV
jgi:hypothetical protein